MATNKNQHFVPRCYLRPFTLDSANVVINLYNIDRQRFIENAPVKHQCSSDYFYGENLRLEKVLQFTEGAYAEVLRKILEPGYRLTNAHRAFLQHFWLLQHMRTEAASRRAIEMSDGMGTVIGGEARNFKLGIRDAVQESMLTFVAEMHAVDDLKICLIKNRAAIPFVTSDDPAVLTNRWHFGDMRVIGKSFGLNSAGNIMLLPLSPSVLCIGYDGDVYNITHEKGWVTIRHDADIQAINQHQFLNCRANIFVRDSTWANMVHDAFNSVAELRPKARHKITYAVLDKQEGGYTRYRVIDRAFAGNDQEALMHLQITHAHPSAWPKQLRWRQKGSVFTNGSGSGYVRRALVKSRSNEGFRKELSASG